MLYIIEFAYRNPPALSSKPGFGDDNAGQKQVPAAGDIVVDERRPGCASV